MPTHTEIDVPGDLCLLKVGLALSPAPLSITDPYIVDVKVAKVPCVLLLLSLCVANGLRVLLAPVLSKCIDIYSEIAISYKSSVSQPISDI